MRRIIGSGTFYMFMFLGHAVGSYSKGDPQLRRHCGKVYSRPGWFGHPHLQYAWQTGSRSVSGIKSVKIALKLGNLWAKSGKIGLRRPSWGRLTTLRFLIALYRAGWAVIQLQSHYHKLRIIYIIKLYQTKNRIKSGIKLMTCWSVKSLPNLFL